MRNFIYVTAAACLALTPLAADYYNGNNTPMQTSGTDSYATANDRQILANIRNMLGANQKYSNITINVTNGVVTLSGYVQSQSDAQSLMTAVMNVQGIQTVNNRVQLTNGTQYQYPTTGQMNANDTYQTQNDHQIVMNIRTQLTNSYNGTYNNITVNVSNGVVTLQGWVNSTSDAQNAVQTAMSVTGVHSVNNLLQVKTN
jgi:hyperosmotically inducible protein